MSRKATRPKPPGAPQRVCILVLGMHRSGTSALVRVLNFLGCDLPKTILGANKSNLMGHWESTPICRLDDRILASASTHWDDWLELNPGWLKSPKAEEFREQALSVLQDEFGASRLFVLKDPRICRLVPFWLGVLEDAGIRPLIVFPLRNPLEVAASLEQRNGFEVGLGQLFWLRHVLDAEFASRGVPRFFTSYDRLLNEWARTMEEAQAALDIVWPRMSYHVAAEVEAFVSRQYRHHEEDDGAVLENPRLSAWLRGAYQILGGWASADENPQDFAELDRIRADLNSAAPAFSRLIAAGKTATGKFTQADRMLAETQAKLARAEQARTAAEEKAACQAAELREVRRKLRQCERQIERPKTAGSGPLGAMAKDYAKPAAEHDNANKAGAGPQVAVTPRPGKMNVTRREGVTGCLEGTMVMHSTEDVEAIRASLLFDGEWYLETYPDVKVLGIDPAEHYLWLGARLNRNPSPRFDGAEYLRFNSDVREAGHNPLLHYERWGKE